MLDDSTEWIKELKEGDKVYSYGGGLGGGNYSIKTVKKVTPKGHIRLDDDDLYRDGYYRVDSWHGYYLKQHTPELEQTLAEAAHISKMQYTINYMDMRKISTDKLQRIWDILNEDTPTPHTP